MGEFDNINEMQQNMPGQDEEHTFTAPPLPEQNLSHEFPPVQSEHAPMGFQQGDTPHPKHFQAEFTHELTPIKQVLNQTTVGAEQECEPAPVEDGVVTVQPVRFASFENDEFIVGTPRKNLDIMQDVNIKITVELGRTKMKVRKVLDMAKGTIIEINKVAGEQVELYVCGKLVAYGEVIVIEDKFGLRITSIAETKTT